MWVVLGWSLQQLLKLLLLAKTRSSAPSLPAMVSKPAARPLELTLHHRMVAVAVRSTRSQHRPCRRCQGICSCFPSYSNQLLFVAFGDICQWKGCL